MHHTGKINLKIRNPPREECANTMPDDHITIPPSFIALFVEPGRIKPSASREHIIQRYDFCEDLATMLVDKATDLKWELQVTEDDVLDRIRQGLLVEASGLDAREAWWVMTRLAELLGWRSAQAGG